MSASERGKPAGVAPIVVSDAERTAEVLVEEDALSVSLVREHHDVHGILTHLDLKLIVSR